VPGPERGEAHAGDRQLANELGRARVVRAIAPLDAYLDEVIDLLIRNPTSKEIIVKAAERLRWAERDGTYDSLLEARSRSFATLPGRGC
jgi:hypothetical protein